MRKSYTQQNITTNRKSYINSKVNEGFGDRFQKTDNISDYKDDEETQRLMREEDKRFGVNSYVDFKKCFDSAVSIILDTFRKEAEGSYFINDQTDIAFYGEKDILDTLINDLIVDRFYELSDLSVLVQNNFTQEQIDSIHTMFPDVDFTDENDVEDMFITEFKVVLEEFQNVVSNNGICYEIYGNDDNGWKSAYQDYQKYIYQINCFLNNLDRNHLFPDGGVYAYIRKDDDEDPIYVIYWVIAITIDYLVYMYDNELLDEHLV